MRKPSKWSEEMALAILKIAFPKPRGYRQALHRLPILQEPRAAAKFNG
jgi:hypothetical protein